MNDEKLRTYLEGYLTDRRKDKFKAILAERTRHFTIVLENIYQAHNSSAVVRTCDIFGVQDIYTVENNYVNKVSRHVAKGSQKWLDFHRFKEDGDNTKECLQDLRNKGYQIIGTTPHTDTVLSNFDVTKKTAFVFGVEKEGISDYVKENADGFLKIPMVGFTESLNISVAAAIILQDVTTRLKKTDVDWQLSEEEKADIFADWVEKTIKNVEQIKEHFLNKRANFKT